jgi:hypothetical protein
LAGFGNREEEFGEMSSLCLPETRWLLLSAKNNLNKREIEEIARDISTF